MKSVLLIGLGRFGRHMAQKLRDLHHEVLAVDRDEGRVNDALQLVTNAQIGDSTNEQFISSLGVRNFDGDGRERRFDFARGGPAEKLFLKLLFPLDDK